MSSHTQGEWKFVNRDDVDYACWVMVEGKYICQVHGKVVNDDKHVPMEEMFANAELITAAPDILKQLQECQDIIKIMLDNNIGRGSLLGKIYLSKVFNGNEKAILKATK